MDDKIIAMAIHNAAAKNLALKQVDLKKGKSQAYNYVKKMQSYVKELYNKNYR